MHGFISYLYGKGLFKFVLLSMKLPHLFFLCCLFCMRAPAQNNTTEPLIALLATAKEDSSTVTLLNRIGDSLLAQHTTTAAIDYFRQAGAMADRLGFNAGLEKALSGIRDIYYKSSKYDSALLYSDSAILYVQKTTDVGRLATLLLNRAYIYQGLGNEPMALKDCEAAMQLAAESGNSDVRANACQVQASIYRGQNRYAEATEYQDKAIALFRSTGDKVAEGHAMYAKAMLLERMKKTSEALNAIDFAIAVADSIKDYNKLAVYHQVLGGILTTEKKYEAAETTFQKALGYAALTKNNERLKAFVLVEFSTLRMEQKNYTGAIAYALPAYHIFSQENDAWHMQKMALLLADAYSKTSHFKEAYEFSKTGFNIRDSFQRKQFSNETAKLQTQFGVKEKDNEIKLLAQQKKLQQQRLNQNRILLGAAVLLLLSLAGGSVLWVRRNQLKHQMKDLELRNNIAADLHDEVGSSLSSIHMLAQFGAKQDAPAYSKELLEKVEVNAAETMDKMSDIVWMLKPKQENASSLRQRIEQFAYMACMARNIELLMAIDIPDDMNLTPEQRKSVYLVFKEAVNNAVKYSGSAVLHIAAKKEAGHFSLEVKDNGRGFDAAAMTPGNGLDNMRKRAEDIGGTLIISAAPGGGVVVKLQAPLE